jgi:hypothetical protein
VIVWVVILGVASWYVIEFFFEDPKDPMRIARMLQTALVAPAVFALQPWLRWLRTTGFTLLLWLPCFAVTLVGVMLFFGVGVGGGTGGSPGFQTLLNWLLAFGLAEAWLVAARGFRP